MLIYWWQCLPQASYGVEDAEYAITQLAQTTMRSEIGKIALDTVFRERELLNIAIVGKVLFKLVSSNPQRFCIWGPNLTLINSR